MSKDFVLFVSHVLLNGCRLMVHYEVLDGELCLILLLCLLGVFYDFLTLLMEMASQ